MVNDIQTSNGIPKSPFTTPNIDAIRVRECEAATEDTERVRRSWTFMIRPYPYPFGRMRAEMVSMIQAVIIPKYPESWSVDPEKKVVALIGCRSEFTRTNALTNGAELARSFLPAPALPEGSYALWSIFEPSSGNHVASMPKWAFHSFGLMPWFHHLNIFTRNSDEYHVWVAKSKPELPYKLDCAIAADIRGEETPTTCLERSARGAWWSGWPEIADSKIKFCHTRNTMQLVSSSGGNQSDQRPAYIRVKQSIHEMEVSNDWVPVATGNHPLFYEKLSVGDVRDALQNGLFTHCGAIATFAFLIWHGIINKENEPRYAEILQIISQN